MKLYADCFRDVLLYIEKHLEFTEQHKAFIHNELSPQKIITDLSSKKYSVDDINTAIENLIDAGMVTICNVVRGKQQHIISFDIYTITYKGHEFINDTRSNSMWKLVKKYVSKLGDLSIRALVKGAHYAADLYVTDPDNFDRIFGKLSDIMT